jgi:hypothetical protein
MNDEEGVVKFIDPRRQEAISDFLSSPKRREKFLGELAHFKALDPQMRCRHSAQPAESVVYRKSTHIDAGTRKLLDYFRRFHARRSRDATDQGVA